MDYQAEYESALNRTERNVWANTAQPPTPRTVVEMVERISALREENARLRAEVERLRAECARHKRNAECYACEAGDPDMDGVQDTKLSRAEAEIRRLRDWIEWAGKLCDCGAFDTDQLVTRGECPDCRKAALAPEVK